MHPTQGITYDPFTAPDRDDPHPTLRRAREHQPVFYSEGLGTWVVTRYDDVVAVMRDPARFSSAFAITNRPGAPPPEILEILAQGIPYEPNSVDLDPPRHAVFRGLIQGAFTPRRIHAQEPAIRALADQLVDAFAARAEVDLVSAFAYPLPTLVIGDLLGVPRDDMERFKRWSDEWLVLLGQLGDMARIKAAAREVCEFQRYVAGMIAARRRHGGDDLVGAVALASAAIPEPTRPSDNALVGLLMTVMFAGHETTTSLLTNTLKLLLQHPDQLARVQADRGLLPAAIAESLRFDPPVPGMYRTTTQPVRLGGVDLPAGAHIHISFASANRDDAYFSAPDRFDIGRGVRTPHLAFGHGIHACVGAALAQLEGRVALGVLLDRLPGLRLPDQTIEPVVSATVRGTRRLRIAWDP